MGRFQSGVGQIGKGLGQVGSGLDRLATRLAVGVTAGLTGVLTTAASFEQAFTGVEKTVDGTDAQLAELEQTVRQMARTIPISFEELSAIGEAGGALGVARDSLDEFIDVVARLSVSTNLSSDQAATALGQLGTILHLTGADYKDFADSLVALGNAGASTEDQIIDLAARFAAAGNSAGLSKEEILALASATASMGIEVEAGGTALSQTFNGITKAIGTGSDEIKAFTSTLGINAAEFKRRWTEDALGTFQAFLTELGKLDKYQQADVLERAGITGVRQLNAIQLMTQNVGFLGDQLNIAENAQGALDRESQKFFDTSVGQWKILVANVRDAAATIGAELLPVANSLIKEFVEKLQKPETQAAIKTFGQDLASGVKGLISELKGVDFSGIIGGMKIAAQVAKGAFDAFRSLPAPIQQLAVAALVANKVSGGAIGQIASGLKNILFGSLKVGGGLFGGRGATAANPVWVQSVAGGVGGAAGDVAAARKFLPTGLTGWLGFLGIAAADFALIAGAVSVFQDQVKNVTVAADYERSQVDRRTAGASLDELKGLRADLAEQLNTGTGDVLSGLLKGIFVNPELQRQLDELDAHIAELERAQFPGPRGGGFPDRSDNSPLPVKVVDSSPTEGDRAIAQGFANLVTGDWITALSKTTEIGLKDVGTTIEHGIRTGLDPYGQAFLGLAQTAANPKDPPVLREIKNHIIAAEELQQRYLESGDLYAAKQVQVTIDGLHELAGSIDDSNAIVKHAADSAASDDRAMLNVVQQYNASQRTTSGQMLDRLRATASAAERTAAKNFSPSFTANITNNVKAYLSVTQALYQQSLYTQIREG